MWVILIIAFSSLFQFTPLRRTVRHVWGRASSVHLPWHSSLASCSSQPIRCWEMAWNRHTHCEQDQASLHVHAMRWGHIFLDRKRTSRNINPNYRRQMIKYSKGVLFSDQEAPLHLTSNETMRPAWGVMQDSLPLYFDRDSQGLTLHIILCFLCIPNAIKHFF